MTRGLLVLAAALLFAGPHSGIAQTVTEELSNQEFSVLLEMLDDTGTAGSFPAILLAAAGQAPTLRDLLELLEKTLPGLTEANEKNLPLELFEIAGTALETGNRFSEAGEMYRQAWGLDSTRYDLLLRAAAMSLETGYPQVAIDALTTIVEQAPSATLQRRAAIQRTRAYMMTGETERAVSHAVSLATDGASPQTWILLWEAATLVEDSQLQNSAREYLLQQYPDSPEAILLAEERPDEPAVTFFPGPGRVLFQATLTSSPIAGPAVSPPPAPTSPPEPVESVKSVDLNGIQTGSFRDEENARYMVHDLADLGLEAIVASVETEQGRFYRVIIPVDQQDPSYSEQLVIRLKELGVEGFRVFR